MYNLTDFKMSRKWTTIGKIMVPAFVVLLLCVIFTAEFPELLSLVDDTANDFTVRGPYSADLLVHLLSTSRPRITAMEFGSPAPVLLFPLLSPIEKTALASSKLFILHSVLRT